METIPSALLAGVVVDALMLPLVVFLAKRLIGRRLDDFDAKRDIAREQRAEDERKAREQREAERTIILAMSRTMLLDNYEKCMAKGSYSMEEREVYHKLYEAYKSDGGNSVIDAIAPRIRELPLTPPRESVWSALWRRLPRPSTRTA